MHENVLIVNQIINQMVIFRHIPDTCRIRNVSIHIKTKLDLFKTRCEKTGLRGFRPGPTQTGLYSHRRWIEA